MAGMSSIAQTIYKIVILLLLVPVGVPVSRAGSAEGFGEKIRKEEERFAETKDRIEASEEKVRALRAREKPLNEKLEALTGRLNALYSEEKRVETRFTDLQRRLHAAATRLAALEKELRTLEKDAARRLVAIYKLGRLGVVPLIFSCDSLSEFLQKQTALEAISRHDSAIWDGLQEKKRAHESVRRQIAQEKKEKAALLTQLRRDRREISEHQAEQAALLAAIRADKKKTLAHLEGLKASAERLEEAIKALKARRDAERRHRTSGAFLAAKGDLPPPVDGDVVEPFGPYKINGHYGTQGFRSGVHFEAKPGTPVRAVHGGEVVYADRFKGYGNMVIIDHGDHFYTLCAQLADFYTQKTDTVAAGEVIGIAGGVSSHAGSGVYFEIRHHGKAIDPMPWLSKK